MTADYVLPNGAALASAFVASALATAVLWRLLGFRMRRARWLRANYRGEQIVGSSGMLVVAVGVVSAAVVAILSYRSSSPGWFAYAANASLGGAHQPAPAGSGSLDLGPLNAYRSLSLAGATGAVASLLALVAFGWLGYRDDTRGDGGTGGFVAHFGRSWHQRRLTTGAQKALGGGFAALLCVQIAVFGNIARLLSGSGWSDGLAVMRSLRDLFIGSHDNWALVPLLRGALIVALSANVLNLFDRAPGRAIR